jgi:hypothetical protein
VWKTETFAAIKFQYQFAQSIMILKYSTRHWIFCRKKSWLKMRNRILRLSLAEIIHLPSILPSRTGHSHSHYNHGYILSSACHAYVPMNSQLRLYILMSNLDILYPTPHIMRQHGGGLCIRAAFGFFITRLVWCIFLTKRIYDYDSRGVTFWWDVGVAVRPNKFCGIFHAPL